MTDFERVSVSKAAKHAGVSRDTIVRWCNSGRLPCTRAPGGHRRILIADLNALLNGKSPSGNPDVAPLSMMELVTRLDDLLEDLLPYSPPAGTTDDELKQLLGVLEGPLGLGGLIRSLEELRKDAKAALSYRDSS